MVTHPGLALFVLFACPLPLASQSAGASPYRLPFTVGDSARLIQGNNGPYGHTAHAAYAFDFIMAIGTPVTATRPGRVIATENRFQDGTRKPGEENFVIVQHDDSTFGRYYHLTRNGVLAQVGALVAAGDTIGRSGNTGASAGPHLHFDVTTGCYRWGCQTVAIRFINAGSDTLVQGRTYVAGRVP